MDELTEGYAVTVDGGTVESGLGTQKEVETAIRDYFDDRSWEDPDDTEIRVFKVEEIDVDVETDKKVKVTFN